MGKKSKEFFCFHCGGTLIWDNDFSFEDYGYEGEGIIHELHCSNCGSSTTCYVSLEEEEDV